MSAFWLKIIAALSMLIDHAGLMLLPSIGVMRIIGRLAFPIYAFFISEGFRYTRNRRKYFLRLFLLGLVLQLVCVIVMRDLYLINVMLVFSASVVLMACTDAVKRAAVGEDSFARALARKLMRCETTRSSELAAALTVCAAAILAVWGFCRAVEVDYGFPGVMLPVFASLTYKKFPRLALFSIGLLALCAEFSGDFSVQWYSLAAIPLLAMYNGKPGKVRMKYFFYIFYPAHLALIYLISLFI